MATHILLINPNSSLATSTMMQAIAQRAAAERVAVNVVTADRSPPMLVTPAELTAAAVQVVELGAAHTPDCVGIIVGAFGDPGLEPLRRQVRVPVVGLCESAMLAAAQNGARFGVATSTPDLAQAIARRAYDLGLAHLYTGIRCTPGDPLTLAADAERLAEALSHAARACIDLDGAQAVIIGGGPLGQAAEQIRPCFDQPVLGPIPVAVARLLHLIDTAP